MIGSLTQQIERLRQELAEARSQSDQTAEAQILSQLGAAYMDSGDVQAAAEAFTDSYDLATRIEDQRGIGWALAGLGLMHLRRGKLDNAIGYFLKGLAAAQRASDWPTQIVLLNHLLSAYQQAGNDERILVCHEQRIVIGRATDDWAMVAQAAFDAGEVAIKLGQPLDAAGHLAVAIDTARRIQDERLEQRALAGLAEACERASEPSRAIAACQEAAAIARRLSDSPAEAALLLRIGRLQHELGEVIPAFRTLREVVDAYRALDDTAHVAESLLAMGRVLVDAEDPQQARSAITRARELYAEIDPSMLATCDLLLSRL
jgi:tetratricopeptide (TPR) repeat protein